MNYQSLEQSFNKFYKDLNCKYWYKNLKSICDGKSSALNMIYNIDFDYNSDEYCFRSGKMCETNDYHFFYDPNTTCLDVQSNIDEWLKQIMIQIREAVNNKSSISSERCKSYSLYLVTPLFMFTGYDKKQAAPLLVKKLPINTVGMHIEANCFRQVGEGDISYDIHGNECTRYPYVISDFDISFKQLTSNKKLLDLVYECFENEFGEDLEWIDVDNFDLHIKDFTVYLPNTSRDRFDGYYNQKDLTKFKRLASYQKDQEVITTLNGYNYYICDSHQIQFLRFIYILKISGLYDKNEMAIKNILSNKYPNRIYFDENAIKLFNFITCDYLNSERSALEKKVYENKFNTSKEGLENFPNKCCYDWSSKGIINLLTRLSTDDCFDYDFLHWLLKLTDF